MLLLKLAAPFSLLTFDPLALGFRQHLLVLHPEFSAMDVHPVHGFDDDSGIFGGLEIRKGETSEDTIVEVVVEGIGLGEIHVQHDGRQGLLADSKRDVFDDNGGGDELVAIRGS